MLTTAHSSFRGVPRTVLSLRQPQFPVCVSHRAFGSGTGGRIKKKKHSGSVHPPLYLHTPETSSTPDQWSHPNTRVPPMCSEVNGCHSTVVDPHPPSAETHLDHKNQDRETLRRVGSDRYVIRLTDDEAKLPLDELDLVLSPRHLSLGDETSVTFPGRTDFQVNH